MEQYFTDKLYIANVLEISLLEIAESLLCCPKCNYNELKVKSQMGRTISHCRNCLLDEDEWNEYRSNEENQKMLHNAVIDYELYADLQQTMNYTIKDMKIDINNLINGIEHRMKVISQLEQQSKDMDNSLNRIRDRLNLEEPNSEFHEKIVELLEKRDMISYEN